MKYFFWIFVYGYCVLIFFFSSLPVFEVPGIPSGYDWMKHFVEYLILTILVFLAFRYSHFKTNTVAATFLFIFLFALSDEIHQFFVPGRFFEVKDILMDVLPIVFIIPFRYVKNNPSFFRDTFNVV